MVTNRVEGTDEWKAMSKSLHGVDPDEMIAAFGADASRCLSCLPRGGKRTAGLKPD